MITTVLPQKQKYLLNINMSSLQKSILKSKRPPSDLNFGIGSRLVYYDYYKLKMLTEILIDVIIKAIQ